MISFADLRTTTKAFDFGAFVFTEGGKAYAATGHNGQRLFTAAELPRVVPPYREDILLARPHVPVLVTEDLDLAEAINASTEDVVATGPAPQLWGRTNWAAVQGRDVVLLRGDNSFRITARNAKVKLLAFGARIVGICDDPFTDIEAGVQAAEVSRKQAASEARGPDLTLLHRRTKAVPLMPPGLLGHWASWATSMSKARATAPEYIMCALLGSVSGIVTGRIGVEVQTASRSSPLKSAKS